MATIATTAETQFQRWKDLHQLTRLGGVHGEGLFAHHVLAGLHDGLVDLEVQMVRRAVVNHLNLRIGQQLAVVAVSLGDRPIAN